VGETDLAFVQIWENVKFGWFRPSPFGERIMPALTGSAPVMARLGKMLAHPVRAMMRGKNRPKGEWPADIRRTTAYADYVALRDELESLALELRDPEGVVIVTDDIHIDDTERRIARASMRRRKTLDPVPELPEPGSSWERYQIQVQLGGVPRRRLHVPGLDD
jgi:hypothetical protein